MGRRIRDCDPDTIYHLTNRTIEGRFLMRPDRAFRRATDKLVKNWIRIHGIELYACCMMSNHFHLVARAPRGNLSAALGALTTQLSKLINKIRGRETGCCFPNRFSEEPILDEESLEEMIQYVLCNPVRARLVREPRLWPGTSSWKRNSPHSPQFQKIPKWAGLTDEEYEAKIDELVEPVVSKFRHKTCLGAKKVMRQSWNAMPRKRLKNGPKPLCHAKDIRTWIRYAKYLKRKTIAYRKAANRLALGELVPFPSGTHPPGGLGRISGLVRVEMRMPEEWRLGAPAHNSKAA